MTAVANQYSVTDKGDYVHLKTWGKMDVNDLDAPANAALAVAKERQIDKLLDDIREVDSSDASIPVQARGVGILWKLREFKKVAIIFKDREIGNLFFSSLEAMGLNSKFKGFTDEAEAVEWLKKDDD